MRMPVRVIGVLAGLLALTTVSALAADEGVTKGAAPAEPGRAKEAEVAQKGDAAKAEEAKKDPKAITKSGYAGGFQFATENGKFAIRIFAATQFRYTYLKYDDSIKGNSYDYSNFYLRRARLWWDGHAYDKKFTYYFHVQLEPGSAVNLHDAWVTYAFDPKFQVGLGRNKIGYGLEFLNSGFGNNMIERSIMSGETDINAGGGFSRWPGGGTEGFALSAEDANTGVPVGGMPLFRSQGVQLSGRTGDKGRVFEYQAGVWQGRNTKGASNPDDKHLFVGRVGFYPKGWINWLFAGDTQNTQTFQVGLLASAFTDSTRRSRNAAGAAVAVHDADGHGYDLALMARYRGFSGDLEWATERYTLDDPSIVGPDEFDRQGWRAQLGYFVKPKKLEVVGRYAQMQRLKDPTVEAARNSGLGFAQVKHASGAFQDAVEDTLNELTFGFNIYLSGAGHQHKLFFDYSRLSRSFAGFVTAGALAGSPDDQKDDRFRTMLQFKF